MSSLVARIIRAWRQFAGTDDTPSSRGSFAMSEVEAQGSEVTLETCEKRLRELSFQAGRVVCTSPEHARIHRHINRWLDAWQRRASLAGSATVYEEPAKPERDRGNGVDTGPATTTP